MEGISYRVSSYMERDVVRLEVRPIVTLEQEEIKCAPPELNPVIIGSHSTNQINGKA